MTTTGLVKVTIAAPHRRIDMALPERSPVAEIVPGLLRHAGDGLADEGVGAGPASLVGLKIAQEQGWTAPEGDSARSASGGAAPRTAHTDQGA